MKASTFRRWIGPLAMLGVGVGALVGAIEYRAARVPSSVAAPATTTTVTAAPVTNTVTVTAAPRVETRVLRPQAAVATRTVTVTAPRTPEQAETRTETVTATETERILQIVSRPKKDAGRERN